MVPLFDLAVSQIGGDIAEGEIVEDARGIVGLHAAKDDERRAGQPHVGEGLLEASAKTADVGQYDIDAAVLDGFGEGVI